MSGGQRFKITVTGEDKASPIFAKVNTSIGNLNKPVAQTQAGLRRLADSPALDSLGKSLVGIGRSAQDAVGAVGRLIPGIGVLAGIGTAGGLVTFAASWTGAAAAIGRTAQAIGIATSDLQLWQSAARSAGLTNDALNSGLGSLASTLQDAVANRNQEALGLMTQLGIRMRTTTEGAVDVVAGLEDISAAFDATRAKGIVEVGGVKMSGLEGAKRIAQTLGVGNLVPLLILGREKIKQFRDEARRSGGILNEEDIARSIAYEQSLERLGLAAAGAANRIGSILTPSITGASNASAQWLVNTNRVLFALETLPLSRANTPAFRSTAIAATTGITPTTAPQASLLARALGGAYDAGAGAGRSIAEWLAGTPATRAPASIATPFTSTGPTTVNYPDRSGAVHVDIRMHGAPPGTVLSVEPTGNVDATARVETTMPAYGP